MTFIHFRHVIWRDLKTPIVMRKITRTSCWSRYGVYGQVCEARIETHRLRTSGWFFRLDNHNVIRQLGAEQAGNCI